MGIVRLNRAQPELRHICGVSPARLYPNLNETNEGVR